MIEDTLLTMPFLVTRALYSALLKGPAKNLVSPKWVIQGVQGREISAPWLSTNWSSHIGNIFCRNLLPPEFCRPGLYPIQPICKYRPRHKDWINRLENNFLEQDVRKRSKIYYKWIMLTEIKTNKSIKCKIITYNYSIFFFKSRSEFS